MSGVLNVRVNADSALQLQGKRVVSNLFLNTCSDVLFHFILFKLTIKS